VRSWIKNGELKAARFGTRIGYRIQRSDYDDFLRRRTLTGVITAHLIRGAATAPDAWAAPTLHAVIRSLLLIDIRPSRRKLGPPQTVAHPVRRCC
jgi:hypothetical protein